MLATDPVNYDCLIGMAKLKYIKGDLEGAREHFDRALVVRPEREKTMYQLGRVLYDLKVYDRSKLLFEQVADSAAGVEKERKRENTGGGAGVGRGKRRTLSESIRLGRGKRKH